MYVEYLSNHKKQLFVIVSVILLNIFYSSNPAIVTYSWVKVTLYLSFCVIVKESGLKIKDIAFPLYLSCLWVIALAILQLENQSSLNGLWYYLGERKFNAATPGIAKNIILGQVSLRPYATFSHPNSMAGYLLVSLYLLTKSSASYFEQLLIAIGVVITQSKAAILSLVLAYLPIRSPRLLIFLTTLLTLSLLVVHPNPLFPTFLNERLIQINPAITVLEKNPIFGVGLGNFIPVFAEYLPASFHLPSILQPVHQALILVVSEVGIIPLIILVWQLKKMSHRRLVELTSLVGVLILSLAFDHYWFTLIQNKIILLLAITLLV